MWTRRATPLKETKVKKGVISRKRKVTTSDMKDLAVYKVEGDKLTMAIGFDDKRPTGFLSTKGSSSYVLTLEKIKDGSEKPADTKPTTK